MRRDIFTEEHEAFRDMVRAFVAREVTAYREQWERDGVVARAWADTRVRVVRSTCPSPL